MSETMSAKELRLAIDQAWEHTQKTPKCTELDDAKEQLIQLRRIQLNMAELSAHNGGEG